MNQKPIFEVDFSTNECKYQMFNGITEFKHYNYVLSPKQIRRIYRWNMLKYRIKKVLNYFKKVINP